MLVPKGKRPWRGCCKSTAGKSTRSMPTTTAWCTALWRRLRLQRVNFYLAMSTYYVSLHRKETAIRKVYGATGSDELQRNVFRYLRIVMVASIFGLAISVLINSVIIQSYSYRLSFTFWVYLLALVLIMGTAFVSVYFQARSIAMNNPSYFIRDE